VNRMRASAVRALVAADAAAVAAAAQALFAAQGPLAAAPQLRAPPPAAPGIAGGARRAPAPPRAGAAGLPPPPQTGPLSLVELVPEQPSFAPAAPSASAAPTASATPAAPEAAPAQGEALRAQGEALRALEAALALLSPPLASDLAAEAAAAAAAAAGATPLPACLSARPVLLPSLAFHDLVFGRQLGAGSFSVVRHARAIRRGLPAAQWPEYAVKVVSTATLRALGYERAARREVAVLARLAHPNAARLASAFRWREGAFLVLEFAPQGDLQALLARVGSLDEAAARFLAAEVAAALASLHALGLAFGDCKPENIVLVEGRRPAGAGAGGAGAGADAEGLRLHAKLTDFAACRAITPAGARALAEAGDILANLRDGDWRAQHGLRDADAGAAAAPAVAPDAPDAPAEDGEGEGEGEGEDERIEGTEEYLAPELAARVGAAARPSVAADAYAFGVTLFQCLAGELPDADAVRTEDGTGGAGAADGAGGAEAAAAGPRAGRGAVRFGAAAAAFPASFPPLARDLVRALLRRDPRARLGGGAGGFADVLAHPFFAPLTDARGAYALSVAQILDGALAERVAPPTARGAGAAPPPDPAWARRHNSTIWAPLPQAYSVAAAPSGAGSAARRAAPAAGATLPRFIDLVGGAGGAAREPPLTLGPLGGLAE